MLFAAGCRRARPPQTIYDEVRQKSQRGDLDGALREADQAAREYSSGNTEWSWRFRVLKAQILVLRGSPQDALILLKDPLPDSLRATDVAVRQQMVLGLSHDFLQQYDEAEKNLADAAQSARAYQPALLCDVMLSRGTLEADRKNYPEAEKAFEQALSLARSEERPFLVASALGSLGNVAMGQEHYDQAVDHYKESLQLSQSLGAGYSLSKTLGNMGWSYFAMGDFENALSLYKQAEEAAAQSGLLSDRVYWLINIGDTYYEQRDYSSAKSVSLEALALAQKLGDKSAITQCLNNLSQIALESSEVDSAETYNQQASALERANPDDTSERDSLLIGGRIQAAKHDFASAEKTFGRVAGDAQAESSQRWEAEARLGEVYQAESRPHEAQRAFLNSLASIEKVRASVKKEDLRLSFLSGAITFYSDFIDFLVSQERGNDALEVAELSSGRALAEGLGASTATLSFPIRNFHPRQTAQATHSVILDYWLGPRHSYLWAITPARVTLFTLPPSAEIDSLVASYRQALTGPRDVLETSNAAGEKLFQLLVAPAASVISPGARVTILPDGSLYALNFETLLAPAPHLHYWIEDVDIVNSDSLMLLAASAKKRAPHPAKLLLIGAPVSPGSDFPNLPQAASEMKRIEKYFPPSNRRVFSGAQATSAAYLESDPSQYSVIHFVAHGTASRTAPLDSAIILTKDGDSYKLYARDIMMQPLHADLVTISSCFCAGSRFFSGEGLVGLTWAFLRAGAREVIAALWEVDDVSTP
ncbi:MAG: CHAT domain-containing protein, partial [Candidatus Acidiferrales bacterium]